MEQGGLASRGDSFVKRPGHAVIGEEPLHGRMELETLNAEGIDKPPRLSRAHSAFGRIDRSEGNQDLGILGCALGNFFIGVTAKTRFTLRINGKYYRSYIERRVMGRSLGHRRRMFPGCPEISRHGRLQVIVTVVAVAAAGFFSGHVKIDGVQVGNVDQAGSLLYDGWRCGSVQ